MATNSLAEALNGAPDIDGGPPNVSDTLSPSLATAQPAPPTPVAPEISGLPSVPSSPVSSFSALASQPQPAPPSAPPPAPPVNPKLNRTLGNTLKGILYGFELGGVPGAVVGGIDPQGVQQTVQNRQAQQHFESAKAAASVGLLAAQTREANLASDEKQAQLDQMHVSTQLWAKRMGLEPTIQVSGTNPSEYDASAQAAIPAVKAANGGLIPSVIGTNSTIGAGATPDTHQTTVYAPGTPKSMSAITRVTEGNSTVPRIVAEYYRAQGRPIPSDNDWANLGVSAANSGPASGITADAESKIAQRDAIQNAAQFFMTTPQLEAGTSAEQTAAKNNVVLQTVKNQLNVYKASGGDDPDTLRQLQTRIDTVEQGVKEGIANSTKAKISDINATAGPEAKAAGQKAAAEASAKQPYELQLKAAELGMQQAFAVNPKTGQRELMTVEQARALGSPSITPLGTGSGAESAVDKEVQLNSQLNDLQLNTSRYKAALNAMGPLSSTDIANMTHILSDPNVNAGVLNNVGMPAVLSMMEQGSKARDWNALSPDKQQALIGALRMKNSALLFQKVSTGMGRASKEAMDIEIANMPSPIEGATVGNQKLQSFQENIDQMASRSVRLPWMDQPQDVRQRIEDQAVQQYNQRKAATPQGKYKSASPVQVGQNIQVRNVPGLSRVTKVYSDGTFDAGQ
jgi:hypothetical protein